jgi:hypothetical protein
MCNRFIKPARAQIHLVGCVKELQNVRQVEKEALKRDPYGDGKRFRGAGPGGDPRFDPNAHRGPFGGSASKPQPDKAGK